MLPIYLALVLTMLRWSHSAATSDRFRLLHLRDITINTTELEPIHTDYFDLLDIDIVQQHYIIQFSNPIATQAKDLVRDLIDHPLTWYIPYNAFVVYTDLYTVNKIQAIDGVVWTGLWRPDYKYSPRPEFQALQDDTDDTVQLIVYFAPSVDLKEVLEELQNQAQIELNCTFQARTFSRNRVVLAQIVIAGREIQTNADLNGFCSWLARHCSIYQLSARESAQLLNYWAKSLVQNDDPHATVSESSSLLFAQHGIQGSGQIIGLGDSGISRQSCFFTDPAHDLIVTNIIAGQDRPQDLRPSHHRKIIQYLAPSGQGNDIDDTGHGTHVAGTIAGKILTDPNGFIKYNGVAPDARIAFFDIAQGTTVSVPIPLDDTYFPYAYAMGARVHSNSWGFTSSLGHYTTSTQSVDEFVYSHPDMLIVFAAGNQGSGGITPPATAKNVIAVGATVTSKDMLQATYCSGTFRSTSSCSWGNRADNKLHDHLAYFSSIGPTADGRIKPDLVASGQALVSASRYCNGSAATDLLVNQGTSMATPNVAAHLLLVREYLTRGYLANGRPDPTAAIQPSAALLKAIAISGSFPIQYREKTSYGSSQPQLLGTGPDSYQGFGRLKLNQVLYFPNSTANHTIIIPRGANGTDPVIQQNQVHEYCFLWTKSNSSYPPRFTLVWTDVPAQTVASISLVQDLDLLVTVGNITYYANGGSDVDSINTVERVQLPPLIANNNTRIIVSVEGVSLPVDDWQAYALVATGPIIQISCNGSQPATMITNSRSSVPSSSSSSTFFPSSSPMPHDQLYTSGSRRSSLSSSWVIVILNSIIIYLVFS